MVTRFNVWGLMIAATVALAGCQAAPSPSGAPFAGQPAASLDASSELAAAMLEEQDLADLDYMVQAARGARYAIAQVDGAAMSEEKKARNEDRFEALRAAVAERLAAKAETAKKVKDALDEAEETTDEKGNHGRAFSFEEAFTTGQGEHQRTHTRKVKSEVTEDNHGQVVSSSHTAEQSNNGQAKATGRKVTRTKTVAEDGTMTITFHREQNFKDGRVTIADWTKTITPGGGVSGSGTISRTRKDGSTRVTQLSFSGSVEATHGQGQNDDTEVTVSPKGNAYGKGGKPVNGETEED